MQYSLFYIDFFVNNIQKNHHLTALNSDFIIVCVTFLIMPFIGLSPFLQEGCERSRLALASVNALYRAFSISTVFKLQSAMAILMCQCPLSGFLHFYGLDLVNHDGHFMVCQCPLSGFLHFYGFSCLVVLRILPLCQCPLSGFLHFYRRNILKRMPISVRVNALYRAFSISTIFRR